MVKINMKAQKYRKKHKKIQKLTLCIERQYVKYNDLKNHFSCFLSCTLSYMFREKKTKKFTKKKNLVISNICKNSNNYNLKQ